MIRASADVSPSNGVRADGELVRVRVREREVDGVREDDPPPVVAATIEGATCTGTRRRKSR